MSDFNVALGAVAPLNGCNASTVFISVTASNQTVLLPPAPNTGGYAAGVGASQIVIDNTSGTAGFYVFVAFGQTAAQATATISAGSTPGSYPCGPGKTVITVPGNPLYVGIIGSAAGPTKVYITPAFGKL